MKSKHTRTIIGCLISVLFLGSCSPKVYSIDECYNNKIEFEEALASPWNEVDKFSSVWIEINTGEVGSSFFESIILSNKEIIPLNKSSTTIYINFNSYALKNFLLENYKNIERIYSPYPYSLHIENLNLWKPKYNSPFFIEFENDNNIYYFYYDDWDKGLGALIEEVYSGAGMPNTPLTSSTDVLYEVIPYEDIVTFAFVDTGYSKDSYIDSLNKAKEAASEFSYFFIEHPECADIPDFKNYPKGLQILYSKFNKEIIEMQSDEKIYPSEVDFMDLSS
jgi:hypothetical protein